MQFFHGLACAGSIALKTVSLIHDDGAADDPDQAPAKFGKAPGFLAVENCRRALSCRRASNARPAPLASNRSKTIIHERKTMTLLVLGMLIFVGIHLVPTFASTRQSLIARFGAGPYKGGFAAISFIGLGLLIAGKAYADAVPLWTPPAWGRHAAMLLMLFAFILLVAAYLPSNVKRLTAHPMLFGVTLWSAAHLLVNGDLASVILFGGLGAFALFDMWSANSRGAAPSKVAYPITRDIVVVAVGLLAYVALLFLHPHLFGVRVI
jgi:uncharacterized membrane protein